MQVGKLSVHLEVRRDGAFVAPVTEIYRQTKYHLCNAGEVFRLRIVNREKVRRAVVICLDATTRLDRWVKPNKTVVVKSIAGKPLRFKTLKSTTDDSTPEVHCCIDIEVDEMWRAGIHNEELSEDDSDPEDDSDRYYEYVHGGVPGGVKSDDDSEEDTPIGTKAANRQGIVIALPKSRSKFSPQRMCKNLSRVGYGSIHYIEPAALKFCRLLEPKAVPPAAHDSDSSDSDSSDSDDSVAPRVKRMRVVAPEDPPATEHITLDDAGKIMSIRTVWA